MAWTMLGDEFGRGPAELQVGYEALGWFVCALTWSAHQGTDGVIPEAALRIVGPPITTRRLRSVLSDLERAGFIKRPDGDRTETGLRPDGDRNFAATRPGLVLNRFTDFCQGSSEAERKRTLARDRQARHRANVTRDMSVTNALLARASDPSPPKEILTPNAYSDLNPATSLARAMKPTPAAPELHAAAISHARSLLIRGYQQRYEQQPGRLAWTLGNNDRDVCSVAGWVVRSGRLDGAQRPDQIVDQVLDGVFANVWATAHSWPWAAIAKNPEQFLHKPKPIATHRPADQMLAGQVTDELRAKAARGEFDARFDELDAEQQRDASRQNRHVKPWPRGKPAPAVTQPANGAAPTAAVDPAGLDALAALIGVAVARPEDDSGKPS